MKTGTIVELMGKVKIRADFGTITYVASTKNATVAWALILPNTPTDAMLRDALKAALAEVQDRLDTGEERS
jgi:hypothetical protein